MKPKQNNIIEILIDLSLRIVLKVAGAIPDSSVIAF